MAITGITQTSNYSQANLDKLLADYSNGKPLPPRIKQKFKAKDFK